MKKIGKKFRVLNDWTIDFDNKSKFKGQSCINTINKKATIYGWGNLKKEPNDYLLHEVLHIVLRASKTREEEELTVQDLANLLT